MACDQIARPDLQALAMLRELPPRCWPEAVVATLADPRRHQPRVLAGQCPMASGEMVSAAATDGPVRMRNGMIQINAAARQPPKEFAQ
jgi:hypothetical protein